MSLLVRKAVTFAVSKHASQKRKYTGEPYAAHLAQVAGFAASAHHFDAALEDIIATAWLHDVMEDCAVTQEELLSRFGPVVAQGVVQLSDMEEGNRATRKALARERLAKAPGYVQSIKCADLISNTVSIVQYDPKFAEVYVNEALQLLAGLRSADPLLLGLAAGQLATAEMRLGTTKKGA